MEPLPKSASPRTTPKATVVGAYLRKRREELGISQKALGGLFEPAVTTQFVSNVERGVTPLPANHVPTLAKVLQVTESELMAVLEKDYAQRLTAKLGKHELHAMGDPSSLKFVGVEPEQEEFWKKVVHLYDGSGHEAKERFHRVCEETFGEAWKADPKKAA